MGLDSDLLIAIHPFPYDLEHPPYFLFCPKKGMCCQVGSVMLEAIETLYDPP